MVHRGSDTELQVMQMGSRYSVEAARLSLRECQFRMTADDMTLRAASDRLSALPKQLYRGVSDEMNGLYVDLLALIRLLILIYTHF